jgi:4-amino-4-deoxy-L-arabinose transferase-like glycosyltransferase
MSTPVSEALRVAAGVSRGGSGWPAAITVTLGVGAVLLIVAGRSTLWEGDEARYCKATLEMIASGDYLVPTFNGALRADKPIMIYWLISAAYGLLGQTALACRIVSILGAAAACFATFVVGRRLLGAKAALWATIALGTTPMLLGPGALAVPDALLLACIVAALAAFTRSWLAPRELWPTWLMGLALGLGLLVKGPLALAVPVMTVLCTWYLGRHERPIRAEDWGRLTLAIVTAVALFLAWAIPANIASKGELLRLGIGYHVVQRALTPLDGKGGALWLWLPYYVPAIAVGLFPWTAFLPAALSATLGGRLGGPRGRAFLLGWAAPTFVLMSLVVTKLPHYVLPMVPALALMIGATVAAADGGTLVARDYRWLRVGSWLLIAEGSLFALGLATAPWLLPLAQLRAHLGLVGAEIFALAAVGAWLCRTGPWRRCVAALATGVIVLELTLAWLVIPAIEPLKLSRRLALAVQARTAPTVPVSMRGVDLEALYFYLNRTPLRLLESPDAVVAWSLDTAPGVLLITRDELAAAEGLYGGPLPVTMLSADSGIMGVARRAPTEVLVLARPR